MLQNILTPIALLLLFSLLFLFSCSEDVPNHSTKILIEDLPQLFQHFLDKVVQEDSQIHNALLLVALPERNFLWQGAAGLADPETGLAMQPDALFRTASIGKMTCATLVMKLAETGKIAIDDKIASYLRPDILNGLHTYKNTDYSGQITLRHLLNHTSGLADYIEDGDFDRDGIPDFLERLRDQPDKFWTPVETIDYVKQYLPPLFPPGGGYHYSDTNYQLLGLIIEAVTAKPLFENYQELLFHPLQMTSTFMEFYQPFPPEKNLSHVYFGDLDYTTWRSVSADWAGGGLVTCAIDLYQFQYAFQQDQLFINQQTKSKMTDFRATGDAGIAYGLGIFSIDLSRLGFPGLGEVEGHIGFSNSFMLYSKQWDCHIIGTLNQALPQKYSWLEMVVHVLHNVKNIE